MQLRWQVDQKSKIDRQKGLTTAKSPKEVAAIPVAQHVQQEATSGQHEPEPLAARNHSAALAHPKKNARGSIGTTVREGYVSRWYDAEVAVQVKPR